MQLTLVSWRVGFALALLASISAGLLASTARAEPDKTRVVVYRLAASVPELGPLATQLGDELVLHLGRAPGLVVLDEAEIKVMLGHEKDKRVLMCSEDQRCLARLQEAIQADKVVTGHLGRLGDLYVVTLKLADTKKAIVERAEAAEADKPEALAGALTAAADRLLGLEQAAPQQRFAMTVAPEGTKVAVVDLAAHGADEALATNLTQLLSLELKKFQGLSVVSRDEIQTMLRFEADKQVLQCKSDTACLVEIGGALGVDYLVTGSIGTLGKSHVITLKLMDVHGAKVASRAAQTLEGAEADLPLALRFAAWELLGHPLVGAGALEVRSNVDRGTLTVSGKEPMRFPLAAPVADLPAGKVAVSLKSKGYYPLYRETFVMDGQPTMLRLQLREVPTPWYEEWWPWTVLGVVVAGAVTTAILLTPSEPESGQVDIRFR